jgi:two-component system cell cycle sensor histidine kinase/response regulator CckA
MGAASAPNALRVLVVDDEASIRALNERVLTAAGYDVTAASDGVEALGIVDGQPRPFDLCVLDVMMPEMSGDELGRYLRRRDPDVKLLYFTGYSDRLFEKRPTLWQDEAFLEKPVTANGLLEAVSLLLFGHTQGPTGGSASATQ